MCVCVCMCVCENVCVCVCVNECICHGDSSLAKISLAFLFAA